MFNFVAYLCIFASGGLALRGQDIANVEINADGHATNINGDGDGSGMQPINGDGSGLFDILRKLEKRLDNLAAKVNKIDGISSALETKQGSSAYYELTSSCCTSLKTTNHGDYFGRYATEAECNAACDRKPGCAGYIVQDYVHGKGGAPQPKRLVEGDNNLGCFWYGHLSGATETDPCTITKYGGFQLARLLQPSGWPGMHGPKPAKIMTKVPKSNCPANKPTAAPTTVAPTTVAPTTAAPTTAAPTPDAPTGTGHSGEGTCTNGTLFTCNTLGLPCIWATGQVKCIAIKGQDDQRCAFKNGKPDNNGDPVGCDGKPACKYDFGDSVCLSK